MTGADRCPRCVCLLLLLFVGCSARSCSQSAPAPAKTDARQTDDAALAARLAAALRAKGPHYVPRTRHKNPDGTPKYTNRLILESSPYLLQHAHNPVNWYPFGDEAFERARVLGRPIFLSIGYSTCHWCHVMEEESFEDEEVARELNEHYVAIKVDREERPDIDAAYMAFVQGFTGSGGWPMSVWLTPAREPFFGGTYFPPRAGVRGARRGLIDLLSEQAQRFAADARGVASAAGHLAQQLKAAVAPEPAGDFPDASSLRNARTAAGQRFDPVMGGARGAPKFPSSFPVRFLLRFARRTGDDAARRMAAETLDHMRAGGIHDQVGGGFHRYATDARWLVPHFEKMLYDNAQLAVAYLEAAQATGDASFAGTTRDTLDYLMRDMQAPDGTFYGATDADSQDEAGRAEEGLFFTWTPSELRSCLGDEDARIAQAWFGVTDAGQLDGRSVLSTERAPEIVAQELGLSRSEFEGRLEHLRARMLEQRAERPPPLRDDKVLVAWNGLAVSAFARAAIVLGEARYAAAATRAADVLVAPLRAGHPLPHAFIEGKPHGRAFSDDHVMLAAALLDLFELTARPTWLVTAASLMDEVERSFADHANGGYYLTSARHEALFLREKPDSDGPTPSVSSLAALTFLRLYAFTEDERFRKRAEMTVRAFSRTLVHSPLSLDQMLLGLDWATDAVKEIVLVVPQGGGALAPSARLFLDVLTQRFVPNMVLVVASEGEINGELGTRVPWVQKKKLLGHRATAYVCERGACKLPTGEPSQFAAQLADARAYP